MDLNLNSGLEFGMRIEQLTDSLVELETRAAYLPACIRMVSHTVS